MPVFCHPHLSCVSSNESFVSFPFSRPTRCSLYHCLRKFSFQVNYTSFSESSLNETARKITEVITKQSRHSHRRGICILLATKHESCNYCYEQLVRVREHYVCSLGEPWLGSHLSKVLKMGKPINSSYLSMKLLDILS